MVFVSVTIFIEVCAVFGPLWGRRNLGKDAEFAIWAENQPFLGGVNQTLGGATFWRRVPGPRRDRQGGAPGAFSEGL